jgi:hypothetical protein
MTILEKRNIFFCIICRSGETVAHSDPTRPQTAVATKDFEASSSKTEVLHDVEQFFRFVLCSFKRLFCDNDIGIYVTVNKMTVNLGKLSDGSRYLDTLLLTVPLIPMRQCSFVLTKTASLLSWDRRLRTAIVPPAFQF